jgi:sRNA-binding protein
MNMHLDPTDISQDQRDAKKAAWRRGRARSRYKRAMEMRKVLVERFPKAFMPFAQPKIPLQIGTAEKLLELTPDLPRADVLNALHNYTHGGTYHAALIAGATRIDLNGEPAGVVTKNHELHATIQLTNLKRRYQK